MNIINKAIQDIHGDYTISIKNKRTGSENLLHCNNIPVIGFTMRLYSSYNKLLANTDAKDNIQLAIGDGSTEPSSSDTAITHQLWRIKSSGYEQYFSSDFRTYTCVHTFTIPASTAYVGNISELGIYAVHDTTGSSDYTTLITHSLLKDAEGHPYTIAKSDLDEITVTYSISVTYNSGISIPAISWYNRSNNSTTLVAIAPLCERGSAFNWVPGLGVSCRLRRYAIKGDYALVPLINGHGQSVGINNVSINWSSTTPRSLGTVRVPLQSCLNNHFIFCFYSEKYDTSSTSQFIETLTTMAADFFRDAPLFAMNLPDVNLFTTNTLQSYSVGTGDGSTQDYTPPIPMWLDGTEKIYIDGVQKVRGIDYTCDSKHNLQKNIELMPLSQAFITDGYIVSTGYFNSSNTYIHTIYICAADLSYPQQGNPSSYHGEDIFLQTRAVRKNRVNYADNKYLLCMDDTHPFIFDLADEISKEVDAIYLYSYYDNDMTKSHAISISLDASNDKSNWTTILSGVSAKGSSTSLQASRVPIADWAHYPLQSRVSYKYWRMRITTKNMIGSSSYDQYHSLGFILMRNGNPLHFNTAPAANSVITMDCDINIPYKDDKHVIDVSAVITM